MSLKCTICTMEISENRRINKALAVAEAAEVCLLPFVSLFIPRILGYVRLDIKLSSHLNWVMLFEMFSEMDLLSPQVLNIILKVVPCNSTDHRPR